GTVTAPAGTCSSGGSSAACTQPYSAGSSIKLGATPAPGARFNGWGGACSGKGDCTLTMSSSKSVTAHFTGGPATAGLALRSLGPPVVRAIGSGFLVTVRFRTTQPGNAQLRLLRSGRRVTSITLTARAGAVRFGPFLVRNG